MNSPHHRSPVSSSRTFHESFLKWILLQVTACLLLQDAYDSSPRPQILTISNRRRQSPTGSIRASIGTSTCRRRTSCKAYRESKSNIQALHRQHQGHMRHEKSRIPLLLQLDEVDSYDYLQRNAPKVPRNSRFPKAPSRPVTLASSIWDRAQCPRGTVSAMAQLRTLTVNGSSERAQRRQPRGMHDDFLVSRH